MDNPWIGRLAFAVIALGLIGILWAAGVLRMQPSPASRPLTRTLDTLPTGTIVVCYTPTHGDGVACVLDPAMQGATP